MQGQPLLDDDLSWMDGLIGGEILLTDENVAPRMSMRDAPETGLGTEPADQPFEMDMSNISSSLMQSVVERGSSSKRPVDRSVPSSSKNEATIVQAIMSSSMMDDVLRMCRNIMRSQFDRGHTMLDQLENASLFEVLESPQVSTGSRDDENYRYVKMHDLIWDMARKILNESRGGRVQAGAQLTELPDGTWWRENLLIVSLMENRIKDIPSDFSPRCPNLSTLLLCRNYKLNLVESSFFQHFISLKVLDLSDTDIEKLPDSICHLTSLTVLLLGWCAKLSFVPSLGKLTALNKLDLSYTGLENLPKGLKRLKDLRYLNLDGSEVRDLQPGILPELSKLQFLKLHQKFGVFLPVSGRDVLRLRKLETLECNFRDVENFRIFNRAGVRPLIACKVTVGRPSFSLLEDLNYTKSKSGLVKEAWFYDLMIDNANFLLKFSFTKIVFVNCQAMRILCPLMDGYRRLEILHLDGLMILETLFEAPSNRSTFPNFCFLKEILLSACSGYGSWIDFHGGERRPEGIGTHLIYCDELLSACSGYGTVQLLKLDPFSTAEGIDTHSPKSMHLQL
ncbi:hypothetical protein DKX38_026545 [Salix brachista]|uniref:Uncharacterized protein n=1 Tax=Salix brachista TaxID=2182728 RepID=A0A5N5JLI6_9ROSI|nr:hypothetical protein DKX38_026545 [Salix brachista]